MTLFAFAAGQGLEEHTSPFDALVMVLEGAMVLTIGGVAVSATPGSVVRLEAAIPTSAVAGTRYDEHQMRILESER